ncbi:MAG TPA: 3'(2'),5'-bisphosphate nucleotidase CysQ [Hyphomicrobium sp.]|nr:3'(2'),5'-bisphosphate nucleotidase CysQ [Hyphomicrobium sp.]
MATLEADSLIGALLPAVLEAARAELRHFSAGVAVLSKADASPVTEADHEAEGILLTCLERHWPHVPVIAEELAAAGGLPAEQGDFFLVDALDGTRHFIRGKPEFSINVALVHARKPVFGLIYVPPRGTLYVTRSDGGAYRAVLPANAGAPTGLDRLGLERLRTRPADRGRLVAFNSRTTGGASSEFLAALDVHEARPVGSSEKFCLIAAGEGDLYARFGPTYEWDTAAGQAILEAAGGCVTTIDGGAMIYGKSAESYLNTSFVAWGGPPLLAGFRRLKAGSAGKGG